MKILLIHPGESPCPAEISGSLESMQKTVGGPIQAIYPFKEPIALICHEEGKLIGLPLNRLLLNENSLVYDVVVGTFFLCAAPADSENFVSLSEEQINRYTDYFRYPHFCPGGVTNG